MASTVVNDPQPSALCGNLALLPSRLTATFVEILQRHFSDEDSIELEELKDLRYRAPSKPIAEQAWNANTDDRVLPTLYIDSLINWDPRRTEHRPAVLVIEQDYDSRRISIGDRRFPQVSVPWGEEHQSRLIVGSHRVVCLGKGRQASLLANECFSELTGFAQVIRQYLELKRFEVLRMGGPFRVREAPDSVGVALTLGVALEHAWSIRAEEPLFSAVQTIAQPL